MNYELEIYMIKTLSMQWHRIHRCTGCWRTYMLLLLLLLAAMTYNQVHYFRVNHLADFTQNGHTKIPVG